MTKIKLPDGREIEDRRHEGSKNPVVWFLLMTAVNILFMVGNNIWADSRGDKAKYEETVNRLRTDIKEAIKEMKTELRETESNERGRLQAQIDELRARQIANQERVARTEEAILSVNRQYGEIRSDLNVLKQRSQS